MTDIPQDQVEAVAREVLTVIRANTAIFNDVGLSLTIARAAIRVLTPMIAEQCAEIAEAYATAARAYAPEDTEETHVSAARSIAFDIRSVKGAVT